MTKNFTVGERRGMIVLLLILVAIITMLYLTNRQSHDDALPLSDSISAKVQSIINDTTKPSKSTKKNKKYKPQKQVPTRDPLSQPVPYETR